MIRWRDDDAITYNDVRSKLGSIWDSEFLVVCNELVISPEGRGPNIMTTLQGDGELLHFVHYEYNVLIPITLIREHRDTDYAHLLSNNTILIMYGVHTTYTTQGFDKVLWHIKWHRKVPCGPVL